MSVYDDYHNPGRRQDARGRRKNDYETDRAACHVHIHVAKIDISHIEHVSVYRREEIDTTGEDAGS